MSRLGERGGRGGAMDQGDRWGGHVHFHIMFQIK